MITMQPALAFDATLSGVFLDTASVSAQTNSSSLEIPISPDPSTSIPLPSFQEASVSAVLINELQTNLESLNTLSFTQTESVYSSARRQKKIKIYPLQKKSFRSNEDINFTIEAAKPNLKILITDARGQQSNVQIYRKVINDLVEVQIPPPKQFTPGRFTLTILDDVTILSQQDFSWGVLAINPNQAVYKPFSQAIFAMTVLNDLGETVCTASIQLAITDPNGLVSTFSTENEGIVKSEQCGSLTPLAPDDYTAQYQIGETNGTYQLFLSATTESGTRTIQDSIRVNDQEPFYISRQGPTRIYPPHWYEMTMNITATETFIGTVIEEVPESFAIDSGSIGNSFQSQSLAPSTQDTSFEFLSLTLPFDESPEILHAFGSTPPPEVTNLYAQNNVEAYDGVAFLLPQGTTVLAVDDGVVAQTNGPYGNTVILKHSWGKSYYGYLSDITVNKNQPVKKGEPIAISGKHDEANQAYLFFAMKRNQADLENGTYGKMDPLPLLSKDTITSTVNTKKIAWEVTIGKGETITLSYRFKTPMISPQFYLAGPLQFYTQQSKQDHQLQLNEDLDNPFILGLATSSAILSTASASGTSRWHEEASTSANYIDPRIAASEFKSSLLPQSEYTTLSPDDQATFLTLLPWSLQELPTATSSDPSVLGVQTTSMQQTTSEIVSFPSYQEPRAFQIAADAVPTNLQVSTVEINAGQYSGDGTTGQNSDTNQTFSTFNFNLAEANVTIRQIIVYFEAQYAAYEDDGDHTGWDLSFDACVESCTANAWSGSGQVTVSDTSILSEDESESMTTRLLANVASESTIASYTGGGTNLEAQVGYRIEVGAADNSIAQAKAKLFVTYTYSPQPTSTNYTNTVRFPLESTQAGDQGTRRNVIAGNCTRNSTCPLFDYNVDLGETSVTEVSTWFRTEYFNDSNSANDINQNVNIQGTDSDSYDVRLEAARGSAQGNGQSAYFSAVPGFAIETADQLEYYHSTGNIYGIGGEVNYTYSAPFNSTTKTKSVSFPFGIVSDGSTTTAQSDTTTIYLPETGVAIQKAWFRLYSTNSTSGAYNIQVTSTVEGTAETAAVQYDVNAGGDVPLGAFGLFHVIDASYYDELEQATATNGIDITIETTANSTNIGGISAELMITYHYTDDSTGYLSSVAILAGQQTTNPDDIYTNSGLDPYFPEQTGVKTVRAAALDLSLLMSDSDTNPPGGTIDVDAEISAGACTNTVAYDIKADNLNAFTFWIQDVADILTADDTTTYNLCIENDGDTLDTSYLGKMNAVLLYTYQVDLPTLSQLMRHGKWFDNTGSRQAFTF